MTVLPFRLRKRSNKLKQVFSDIILQKSSKIKKKQLTQ